MISNENTFQLLFVCIFYTRSIEVIYTNVSMQEQQTKNAVTKQDRIISIGNLSSFS